MSRYKAALIHLGLSAAIAGSMLALMLTVWYPGPFFMAVGGAGLVLILLGVDVTIGPLLTLIVFDSRKKRLKLDLAVIGFLQVAAFLYGASTIFAARPAYVAFVVDRFEIVRAADLDPEDMKRAKLERFRTLPLLRPQVIAVETPSDPEEKMKALDLALAGKDVQLMPQYYAPYETQVANVKRKLQPMKRLKDLNSGSAAQIDRSIQALGKSEDAVGFLPLSARDKDLAVVIDRATGEILDYWTYRPWEA